MTFDSTQLVPGAEDVNRAFLDLLDKINRRLDNLESITAKTVNATTVKADTVQAQTVTTQDLTATNGTIDALTADSGAFATSLTLGGYPVVESGSNTDGNWVKWADGTMMQWGAMSGTADCNIAYAGGFRTDNISFNLPQAFINTNYRVSGLSSNVSGWVAIVTGATTTATSFRFARFASATGVSFAAQWMAIGRWL